MNAHQRRVARRRKGQPSPLVDWARREIFEELTPQELLAREAQSFTRKLLAPNPRMIPFKRIK